MAYRFLTEQEFKFNNKWSFDYKYPKGWNERMLKYLGQTIPEIYWKYCEQKSHFLIKDEESGREWSINYGEYCTAEQSESQPALKYKVGDLVFINTNSEHASQGKIGWKLLKGTVIKLYAKEEKMYDYAYRVKWENDYEYTYRESDLIPYTTLDSTIYKFNVGDKVKVVGSGNGFNPAAIGATAIITKLVKYKNGPGYMITWPELHGADLDKHWFNGPDEAHGEESFELYKEEIFHKGEHIPGDFQVGDFIVSLKTYTGHRDKGEVFTAKRITGEYVEYNLNHPTGLKDTFRRAYPHEIPRHLTAPMLKPLPNYDPSSPKKEDIKLIEPVHSVSIKLSTKKKNKFKF